jgi:ATP-dependent Clp protease ATP-binding subunit ClpC
MSSLPKFDSRAKNALAVAQQIAIQLGHNYIGSEHVLFGILSQPQEHLPFQVAFMDNVSNQDLLEIIRRQGLERFQQFAKKDKTDDNSSWLPEITQELQNCLDSAIRVAENNNYSYIGIEHLIYGILDTKGSHGQLLMNLTESGNQKLKELLNSLFTSYSKGVKSEETKTTKKSSKKQRDSALDYFTTNLNQKVTTEPNFNLLEREKEIDRMIQILSRKNKNNPIIIGEPGVGKTALAEGLAKRINDGKVPEWLQDKRVLSLDIGNLVAGSVFRGEFENRVKAIIEEIVAAKDVILFIDEIHAALGAGASGAQNNGPDFVQMLKPALSRGEMSVVGATTEDEYRNAVKKDKAFERRFQPVRLDEPTVSETHNILRGIKSMYENHHNATFPDEHLMYLVELCDRFLPERYFPDKAIDVLDETLVRSRILSANELKNSKKTEKGWVDVEQQILNLIKEKNEAILQQNFELSEKFEKDQKALENQLAELNVKNQKAKELSVVTKQIIEKVISEMSGVPINRISSDIYTQIKDIKTKIDTSIFGQDEASSQISKALKRSYAGVSTGNGPIASFLLLGPTGVGKTEMVKVLTQELFGDVDKYLLKLDMSEFRERHQMSRLLGAPAGYVGYEDAPQLTEFLRKRPNSVILFDEIEKANPEALNILLQMLEDGKVTDAKGNEVRCDQAIIFLTSNLGKSQLNKFASKIGFVELDEEEEVDYQTLKDQVMAEVEKSIRPEILGRITSKIVFRPINKKVLQKIISKELGILQRELLRQGRTLTIENSVITFVINKAKEKIEYGAREVKALIAEHILDKVADFILDNPTKTSIELKATSQTVVIAESPKKLTTESYKAQTVRKEVKEKRKRV